MVLWLPAGHKPTVTPIQELLHRIRWDRSFADAKFTIGYYDRPSGKIMMVPYRELYFPAESPAVFELVDEEGCLHSIPFHRVRRVWRNGELIWERDL